MRQILAINAPPLTMPLAASNNPSVTFLLCIIISPQRTPIDPSRLKAKIDTNKTTPFTRSTARSPTFQVGRGVERFT